MLNILKEYAVPETLRFAFMLFLLSLSLFGCGSTEIPVAASASPVVVSAQQVEPPTPITIEVTRLVEKQIIVTSTPTPAVPCAPQNIELTSEVVIGALAPLSGQSAVGGMKMQAGINLAVAKINAAGGIKGKPIRLVTYDTGGNPDLGAQHAQQLIIQDCAIGIVGVYDSAVGISVKEIAHQYGVPIIFVDTYRDEITESLYPEVFRIAPTVTMLSQLASKWLADVGDYNQDGTILAVVIGENTAYGQIQTEQTVRWFTSAGIQYETISVDLPTSDFSPIIARIVDMDVRPDVIFIRVMGETGLYLQRQLLDNGISPRKDTLIVATQSALHERAFWNIVGDEGVYTIVFRMGRGPNNVPEMGAAFAEAYRAYFNDWPNNSAFSGFDAIHLIADAVTRSPSLLGADLVQTLASTDLVLAAGRYRFPVNSANPPDNEKIPAYLWHQWQDVPLLYVQYTEPNQSAANMGAIWPPAYQTVAIAIARP